MDEVQLNFSPLSLHILNVILGLIMFGVALDIDIKDFKKVLKRPQAFFLGLGAQFLLLPAFTFLIVWLLKPPAGIALGMFLVAACPGGNFSNFITHVAKGNTVLSISMSSVSTLVAVIFTPLNFTFWASMLPETKALLTSVSISPFAMAGKLLVLIVIPVLLGYLFTTRFPSLAGKLKKPLRYLSLGFFALFIVGALAANFSYFLVYIGSLFTIVLIHNTVALCIGYFSARWTGLPEKDRRAVAFEIGIQNSGLGLILIFDFFGGMGGMALIASLWGIWHLVSGLGLALFWSRKSPE